MSDAIRVLVVDDAELARTTLTSVLRRAGHEVRAAATIGEAEHELEHWAPQCLVVDARLPDGDGIDFARRTRGQRDFFDLRVVVLSGDPLPEAAADAADAFLLKPADVRSILAAVAPPAAT